jgi:uncharacterized protein (DUF983 family)
MIGSILANKCPACREGKMWNQGPYKLSKMTHMNKRCSKCNENLEPEPSFYTGALYVGYAFTVAIVLGVFTAFQILTDDPEINTMFFWVMVIIVLFAPLSIRYSRNIWAYTFIKRNKNYK